MGTLELPALAAVPVPEGMMLNSALVDTFVVSREEVPVVSCDTMLGFAGADGSRRHGVAVRFIDALTKNYVHRWGVAEMDPYILTERVAEHPKIAVLGLYAARLPLLIYGLGLPRRVKDTNVVRINGVGPQVIDFLEQVQSGLYLPVDNRGQID